MARTCHAERSEASRRPMCQTLRSAQGDKQGVGTGTFRFAQGDKLGLRPSLRSG